MRWENEKELKNEFDFASVHKCVYTLFNVCVCVQVSPFVSRTRFWVILRAFELTFTLVINACVYINTYTHCLTLYESGCKYKPQCMSPIPFFFISLNPFFFSFLILLTQTKKCKFKLNIENLSNYRKWSWGNCYIKKNNL